MTQLRLVVHDRGRDLAGVVHDRKVLHVEDYRQCFTADLRVENEVAQHVEGAVRIRQGEEGQAPDPAEWQKGQKQAANAP